MISVLKLRCMLLLRVAGKRRAMPIYQLTPNPEHLNDPAWKNSNTKQPLIIRAANEAEARKIATEMTRQAERDDPPRM